MVLDKTAISHFAKNFRKIVTVTKGIFIPKPPGFSDKQPGVLFWDGDSKMKNKKWTFFIVLVGLFSFFLSSRISFAATSKGMIVYTTTTTPGIPVYRLYNGTNWDAAPSSALSVGTGAIKWIVLKQCPVREEYILGTLDVNNKVKVQVYRDRGGTFSWGDLQEVATVGTTPADQDAYRGFDIAYEYMSGRALVVANNSATANPVCNPVYWLWNGANWTWSGPYVLNITVTPLLPPATGTAYPRGAPVWIRLKPWPVSYSGNTDGIMLSLLDTTNAGVSPADTLYEHYNVMWTGYGWETFTGGKQPRVANNIAREGMDIITYYSQYSTISGTTPFGVPRSANFPCAMVRFIEFLSTYYYPVYREYRAQLSHAWAPSAIAHTLAYTGTTIHPYWVRAANRAPKRSTFSYLNSMSGYVSSDNRLHLLWMKEENPAVLAAGYRGAVVSPIIRTGTTPATAASSTTRCFDVAMESDELQGLMVWGESAISTFQYARGDFPNYPTALTWSGRVVGPNVGGAPIIVTTTSDPESNDIMAATINSAAGVYVTKWDGTANTWGTPFQCTTVSPVLGHPVDVVFQVNQLSSKLKQNNYRWYVNKDAVQPDTALAAENVPLTNVAAGTILRLRMNVGVSDRNLDTRERFNLEYSTSLSGPWEKVAVPGSGPIWKRQIVDPDTESDFCYSEIALDSLGKPAIAYDDVVNKKVKYAHWNGASWDIETVPTNYAVWYGYPNLSLNSSDEPRISYACDADTDGLTDLGCAYKSGVSWSVETPVMDSGSPTIDPYFAGLYSSMDVDSSGNPHIIHLSTWGGVTKSGLSYIKKSGTWGTNTLIDDPAVTGNNMGGWSAMKINKSSGHIHLAYDDFTGGVVYRKWNGVDWLTTQELGTVGTMPVSIDVDSDGYPHIVRGGIVYYKNNGASWSTEDLTNILPPTGAGTTKTFVSLYLDSPSNPYIVYYYSDTNSPARYGINYAWKDGATWKTENIDEIYNVYSTLTTYGYGLRARTIKLDANKVPHVTYGRTGFPHYKLIYATKVAPSAIMQFYNNPAPLDGATITANLISGSSVSESYSESFPSPRMPNTISNGGYGEWDWVIKLEGVSPGATYYFRMVKGNDEPLDNYTNYPELTVVSQTSMGGIYNWEEDR